MYMILYGIANYHMNLLFMFSSFLTVFDFFGYDTINTALSNCVFVL